MLGAAPCARVLYLLSQISRIERWGWKVARQDTGRRDISPRKGGRRRAGEYRVGCGGGGGEQVWEESAWKMGWCVGKWGDVVEID